MTGTTDTATTRCPGCGLELVAADAPPTDRYTASPECWQLFGELSAATMGAADTEFVHQHCVDAYGAQHAGEDTKPITTVFSLVGLYLSVQQNYTGRQIQQAHVTLGEQDRSWPALSPPADRGDVTVQTVLDATPGDERERAIERWTASVWRAWDQSHRRIRELCRESLGIDR